MKGQHKVLLNYRGSPHIIALRGYIPKVLVYWHVMNLLVALPRVNLILMQLRSFGQKYWNSFYVRLDGKLDKPTAGVIKELVRERRSMVKFRGMK